MSLLDFFSKDHPSRDEISKSKFDEIFNRDNRSRINKDIKELNKSRFKPGIIFQYNRFSTLITCEYGYFSGPLRIKIPQKSGQFYYKSLEDRGIVKSPGEFGKIEVGIIFKNKKYFLQIDINSKKNYENGQHAHYTYESKTFSNILKTKPIIDFLIKKIHEFDSSDKSNTLDKHT
jgi:hypothetical protein